MGRWTLAGVKPGGEQTFLRQRCETEGAGRSLRGMKLSVQEEEMVHLSLSDQFVSSP